MHIALECVFFLLDLRLFEKEKKNGNELHINESQNLTQDPVNGAQ